MSSRNYAVVTSLEGLQALIEKLLADGTVVGFDVETGYLGPDREKGSVDIDWDQQFVAGFSITNSQDWARYVPLCHDNGTNVPEREAWEMLKPVLETLPTIAHNLKFEARNLRALERKGRGPRIDIFKGGYYDSMVESYVLSKYQRHGLKDLVKAVFDHDQPTLKSLFPGLADTRMKYIRFNTLEITPEVTQYTCEDSIWTLGLHDFFWPQVQQRRFIMDLEMKTVELLCDMEDAGHAVDWDALREQEVYGAPFKEAMTEAARAALTKMVPGTDFSTLNLNSSPQMREALYGVIGLKTTRTTKSGALSTDAIALESLSRQHPAVKKVLEVREVANLSSRLTKWSHQYSQAWDSRVHASFNQVVVPSGRFSANDPSIQQLPKDWRWSIFPKVDCWEPDHWAEVTSRAAFGKHYWNGNFRDFLVAEPGAYLLSFDYSQVELRALAGLSQEPALLKSFREGIDVHTMTTALMLGKNPEDIDHKTRQIGKTMNFALLYGMGAESLAQRLAISETEAERLYEQYFSAFSNVTAWMSDMKKVGMAQGYVETYWKRKVTLWDLQSKNPKMRSKGERLCVNAPVQGTAADIMKVAMLRSKAALERKGWWMTKVRMINNLHDALTFEATNDIHPEELRTLLRECVVLEIPKFPKLRVDWELGLRWGSSAKWADEQPVEIVNGVWQPISEEAEEHTEAPVVLQEISYDEPVPEVEEQKILYVELISGLPKKGDWEKFLSMVQEHPGDSVICLKTPSGEELHMEKTPTSLTPHDEKSVSRLLGGARVYYEQAVDISELSRGLAL